MLLNSEKMKILLKWYWSDIKKVMLLLALIALFSSSLTVNYFLNVEAKPFSLSPLKQIERGTLPQNVICTEGLHLVFKSTNNLSACVKPSTAIKLIERGWGTMVKEPKPPNVLVILADDLAYTDLKVFGGGDISMPNLDNLAKEGTIFTNFHSMPVCSATRSILMTGVDTHLNGFGIQGDRYANNQIGKPGYEGYLNDNTVSVAQLFKDSGYHTYISGKWHLGEDDGQRPYDKGFEQVFTLIGRAGLNFNEEEKRPLQFQGYYRNNTQTHLPKNFFSSDFYTDTMIGFIKKNYGDGKPMFMYLPFTAVHIPLQAPEEYLQKYEGKYDMGWDVLREKRFENMKKLAIIPEHLELPPRNSDVPAWDELTPEQKRFEAKRMEVYAAMADNMDYNVGRLLDYLKKIDEYDNTLIIFFSDNGAESINVFDMKPPISELTDEEKIRRLKTLRWLETFDNSIDNIGKANSAISYGPGWADVGQPPFKLYKGFLTEGGNRVPLIVKPPYVKSEIKSSDAFISILDLMPTFLDYANIEYPTYYLEHKTHPLLGKSLRPLVEGKSDQAYGDDEYVAFELFDSKTLYKGDWKILQFHPQWDDKKWRLYNLAEDPSELIDLSEQEPELFQEMISLYEKWAKSVGVIPPEECNFFFCEDYKK